MRQPSSCQHPDHIQPKGKKAPFTWAAPIDLIELTKKEIVVNILIGGKLCVDHLKSLTLLCTASLDNTESGDACGDVREEEAYEPDTPNITLEMEETSAETISGIQTLLGTSPIKFQIKRKFVENLGEAA